MFIVVLGGCFSHGLWKLVVTFAVAAGAVGKNNMANNVILTAVL